MRVLLAIIILFLFTGCASGPVSGLVFTYNHYAGEQNPDTTIPATVEFEGCQYSLLGLFSFGDSSAGSAAQDNGIRRIASIDYSVLSILTFVFVRNCSIVRGATY